MTAVDWKTGDTLFATALDMAFGRCIDRGGDGMSGPLSLAADPAAPLEAATKQYVDNRVNTGYLPIGGGTLTGPLTLYTATPAGALEATPKQYVDSQDASVRSYVAANFATLSSPLFTGVPAGPTPPPGTNSTRLATTAFVMNAISSSVAGVSLWNGRGGTVTMTSTDVSNVNGLLTTGGTMTGPFLQTYNTNPIVIAAGSYTAPQGGLQGMIYVQAVNPNNAILVLDGYQTIPSVRGRRSAGTPSGPGATSTAQMFNFDAQGWDTTQFASGAQMQIRGGEVWSPTGHGAHIDFYTCQVGTVTLTEKVRISDAGALLVGTTVAATGELFNVNGVARINTLQIVGGTLTLAADPGAPLQAATKQYVDKMMPITGGTFSGSISAPNMYSVGVVQAGGPPNGDAQLVVGNGTNTGYVAFYAPDGTTRRGYMGFCDTATMNINVDSPLTTISVNAAYLSASGRVTANEFVSLNRIMAMNDGNFYMGDGGHGKVFQYASGWLWDYNWSTGDLAWETPSGAQFVVFANGVVAMYGPQLTLAGANYGVRYASGAYASGNTFLFAWDAGASQAIIAVDNGAAVYRLAAVSDERVKTDVVTSTLDCVAALNALDVVEFDWVPVPDPGKLAEARANYVRAANAQKVRAGLIAQDVALTLPEAVSAGDDTQDKLGRVWSLDNNVLSAVIIGAIKQMNARLAAVEARP